MQTEKVMLVQEHAYKKAVEDLLELFSVAAGIMIKDQDRKIARLQSQIVPDAPVYTGE